MKNWRKVFAKSEKFTDKFKPFKTENKQELINRAEFTGDKFPSSGDSAKKELSTWKAGDTLSKKDRKSEQGSNGSAVMNEKIKREDYKSQKTSSWRNTFLKKTAEVNFKQKPDGGVEISVTTPTIEPSIPQNPLATQPLEESENLDEEEAAPLEDKTVKAKYLTEEYLRNYTEKLKGGKADGKPDDEFNQREFSKGLKVEKEHTSDPEVAKEIVKDHLTEMPDDYYTKLNKMEKGGKLNWRSLSKEAWSEDAPNWPTEWEYNIGEHIEDVTNRKSGYQEYIVRENLPEGAHIIERLKLVGNKYVPTGKKIKISRDAARSYFGKLDDEVKGLREGAFNSKGSSADEDPSSVGGAAWVDIAAGNLTNEEDIINSILNKAEEEGVDLSQNDAKQRYLRWKSWKKRQASLDKEAWQMIPEKTIEDLIGQVLDENSDIDEPMPIINIVKQVMDLGRKAGIKGFENYKGVSNSVRRELQKRGWEISRIASQSKEAWQLPEKKPRAAYPEAHAVAKQILELLDGNYIDPMTSAYRVSVGDYNSASGAQRGAKDAEAILAENNLGECIVRVGGNGPGGRNTRVFVMVPYTMTKKADWRNKLAASEPDVHFKRKPDGTFELNVTHPNPEPDLPILNTQPPAAAPPQPEQPQAGIAPTSNKKTAWQRYTPGMTVVIDNIPGFSAGGDGPHQMEIVRVEQKYDEKTGDQYDVVVTSNGSKFDTRNGNCIKGPKAYYMVTDRDEFLDSSIGSLKNECTETPKKEWIIKEAKAEDNKTYQLIGRECDRFCGIFIERKVENLLQKAAAKWSKSNIIDFEKVDKVGATWRENINEAQWLFKFDDYIYNINERRKSE